MALGADVVFCRGPAILHSEQYFGGNVQEYGHAERNVGSLYKPTVPPMGHQTPMEPLRGHNSQQALVDRINAAADVSRYVDASVLSSADRR